MLTGGVRASVAGSPGDVCAEVADLLGVSADTVDPSGNLISQGLDSIRMMSLAGRWRRRGIDVDFAALAADPTVEAWSQLVGANQNTAEPDVVAAVPTGTSDDAFPLAPMQHAMWVGRHDNQPLGGVAGHLYVEFDGGAIDPERLRDAARKLATRHPICWVPSDRNVTRSIGCRVANFVAASHRRSGSIAPPSNSTYRCPATPPSG